MCTISVLYMCICYILKYNKLNIFREHTANTCRSYLNANQNVAIHTQAHTFRCSMHMSGSLGINASAKNKQRILVILRVCSCNAQRRAYRFLNHYSGYCLNCVFAEHFTYRRSISDTYKHFD